MSINMDRYMDERNEIRARMRKQVA
jgi:hypothetical protein